MSYDDRNEPAYPQTTDILFADNKHILRWWKKKHDNLISKQISDWHWYWSWGISDIILLTVPNAIVEKWKKTDPICQRYSWENVLTHFTIARATQLGLDKDLKKSKNKCCPICNKKFREDALPYALAKRLGIDHLDFCPPCLTESLFSMGNNKASKKEIIEYLIKLADILERVPNSNYGDGMNDLTGLDKNKKTQVLIHLRNKPSYKRVKKQYGSWLNALIKSSILEDGTRRTSFGTQCLAKDGHVCYSIGEKTIDDFMSSQNIIHEKEPYYPDSNYRADFVAYDIFVEYFGLVGNPKYDEKIKVKKALSQKYGIQLISIYPKDLVALNRLEELFDPVIKCTT